MNSIPRTVRREWTHFNWGNTKSIMDTILKVSDKDVVLKQTKDFSNYFKASNPQAQIEKLRELWAWVRYNIEYVPDPKGIQKIKHPARTYEDKYADCKSMSIFVHSVLCNLNIPHYYVFTSYLKSKRIQHVYTVAVIEGRKIPIDTVYDQFDAEEPYTHLVEKRSKSMTKIVEIAGTNNQAKQSNIILPNKLHIPYAAMTEGEVMLALNVRQYDLLEAINKGNGFHQEAGEAARFRDTMHNLLDRGLHSSANKYASSGQLKQLIQNLERRDFFSMEGYLRNMTAASVAGPFDPSAVQIEECRTWARNRAQEEVNMGAPFNVEELAARYLDSCIDTKAMENIVNAHVEDSGLSFLYDLMGNSDVPYNAAIIVKQLNQGAWIEDAARATGLSISVIKGICSNGVLAKAENTPEGLRVRFLPYMVDEGVSIGEPVSAIILAIATLVSALVSALAAAGLFQRNVKPYSRYENAFKDIIDPNNPNFRYAEADFTNLGDSSGNSGSNGSGSNGGNNALSTILTPTNLLVGAAAAYYFTK